MTTRRLYYDDSFQREFDARVLSCDRGAPTPNATWEVVLDATAFYPTSGGQPHDIGRLNDAHVMDVRDEGDEIVHVVDREFASGPVHGCVDWTRRFDHMQQHTGQHLLSAVFQERYGRPTVSFHLGAELCTIDLRGPEPDEEVLEGAERAANQIVADDRQVTVRYGTAEEFAQLGVRKQVERSGILRAIEIEGADLQPCGGTHVQRTAQIGITLIRGCSRMHQDWRVEFVCGVRAERLARNDFRLLQRVARELQCAPQDVVPAAQRAVSERDTHFKAVRSLLERLAEAEASLALQASAPTTGVRVISRVFREDTPADYLGQFATAIAKADKSAALLARLPSGDLVFAQHPSVGKDMNALLRRVVQELGGKGGGTRDFARGRLADTSHGEKAIEIARGLLLANSAAV